MLSVCPDVFQHNCRFQFSLLCKTAVVQVTECTLKTVVVYCGSSRIGNEQKSTFVHVHILSSPLNLHVFAQSSYLTKAMNNVSNTCVILVLKVFCSFRRWERLASILENTIGYSNKVIALSHSFLKEKGTSYSLILKKAVTFPYQQEPYAF